MTVVQRQSLQEVPLEVSQSYGVLHRQAPRGDAGELGTDSTRLLGMLIKSAHPAIPFQTAS
jgi:hypothetical protein